MLTEFQNYLSTLQDVSDVNKEFNTISFKYKGLFFLFATDESDPYYIRLILPSIATTDGLKKEVDLHSVINDYNSKFKAAKMSLFEGSIWLSIEQFLYSRERATDLFARMINILVTVITEFRNENLKQ